ncbi:hypothetical protein D3C76_1757670 [compost metagenome]
MQSHWVGDAFVVERPDFRLRTQLRLDFFQSTRTACITGLRRCRFGRYVEHRMGTLDRVVYLLTDLALVTLDARNIEQLEMLAF